MHESSSLKRGEKRRKRGHDEAHAERDHQPTHDEADHAEAPPAGDVAEVVRAELDAAQPDVQGGGPDARVDRIDRPRAGGRQALAAYIIGVVAGLFAALVAVIS